MAHGARRGACFGDTNSACGLARRPSRQSSRQERPPEARPAPEREGKGSGAARATFRSSMATRGKPGACTSLPLLGPYVAAYQSAARFYVDLDTLQGRACEQARCPLPIGSSGENSSRISYYDNLFSVGNKQRPLVTRLAPAARPTPCLLQQQAWSWRLVAITRCRLSISNYLSLSSKGVLFSRSQHCKHRIFFVHKQAPRTGFLGPPKSPLHPPREKGHRSLEHSARHYWSHL